MNNRSSRILSTTAFLAGFIKSQQYMENFIEFPISSMFAGIINGTIYSFAINIMDKFFESDFEKYLISGLLSLSTLTYIIKNTKN